MHQHHQHQHRDLAERAPAVITTNGMVLSVVYVTAQPTFTGVIGGYATVSQSNQAQQTQQAQSPPPSQSDSSDDDSAQNSIVTLSPTQLSTSRAIVRGSTTTNVAYTSSPTTFATSSGAGYTASSTTDGLSAGASSTSGSSSEPSSGGVSPGAMAGIVIGVILLLGALAGLCLFLLGKKKKQKEAEERANSEKNQANKNFGAVPVAAAPDTSSKNAPRLSLRPVSRLVPELMGGSRPKSRLSQGNMLTTFHESSTPAAVVPRPGTAGQASATRDNPFNDPENPFADPEKNAGHANHLQPMPPASTVAASIRSTDPSRPSTASTFNGPPSMAMAPSPMSEIRQEPVEMPVPVAVAAPLPSRSPVLGPAPSLIPAQGPVGAPAPVVASGPGPDMPQGNVYRVLMDFNPTMDDELGLRAGTHVRLLHEYDDGWALCIRLDRSQQGVVPRTCLAQRPSKPRPAPGPPGPGSNSPQPYRPGPPPNGRMSPAMGSPGMARPMTPTSARGQMPGSPAMGHNMGTPRQGPSQSRPVSPGAFNQTPRPLSPGPRPQPQPQQQKRSMSPGPYGAGGPQPMPGAQQRPRSNSASALNVRERRNSPPGPSKLGAAPQVQSDSPGLAM